MPPGFIRAISAPETMPRLRGDSTMWMLIASEVASSVSLSTRATPTSAARSSVRFWLQACTFMPSAKP